MSCSWTQGSATTQSLDLKSSPLSLSHCAQNSTYHCEICITMFYKCICTAIMMLICYLLLFPLWGFCACSLFCCAVLCVLSSFPIILMGKRELVALLCLSSWCLMAVIVLLGWSQCVNVVFPDHSYLVLCTKCLILVCISGLYHTNLELKKLNISLFISFNRYFGCSKEPSHREPKTNLLVEK